MTNSTRIRIVVGLALALALPFCHLGDLVRCDHAVEVAPSDPAERGDDISIGFGGSGVEREHGDLPKQNVQFRPALIYTYRSPGFIGWNAT
jgi:hypothetical protein